MRPARKQDPAGAPSTGWHAVRTLACHPEPGSHEPPCGEPLGVMEVETVLEKTAAAKALETGEWTRARLRVDRREVYRDPEDGQWWVVGRNTPRKVPAFIPLPAYVLCNAQPRHVSRIAKDAEGRWDATRLNLDNPDRGG